MYPNQNNFNWDYTNKEIIIFIPNWKRKNLLIPTLQRFKTELPIDKWLFLVVNDGHHEDLSDLEKYNLKWFTFERDPVVERNGCMIRNKVIKNIRSRLLATRDPEIIIEGDFLSSAIKIKDSEIYRPSNMVELCEQETSKILENPYVDLKKLSILREWIIDNNRFQAFHAGATIPVKILLDINGYDERFKNNYGFEDWDLLRRLRLLNIDIIIDKNIKTYHIWHPMIRKFKKTIISSESLYKEKTKNNETIVNKNIEWGLG